MRGSDALLANTNAANIRARYGAGVDEWMAARNEFLSPTGQIMFGSDPLKTQGLGA